MTMNKNIGCKICTTKVNTTKKISCKPAHIQIYSKLNLDPNFLLKANHVRKNVYTNIFMYTNVQRV